MLSIPVNLPEFGDSDDDGGEIGHAAQGADYSPPAQPLSAEVPADLAGLRFDQALAQLFPQHSRSRLQLWVREGRVLLDDRPADAKRKVWGGERVELVPAADKSAASYAPEDIPLRVVYEDAHLLAIDKPAGLVVHPGSGNWDGTLLNALLHHAPQLEGVPRAGIVHRLDKETSGLLVVGKTIETHTALVRAIQARTVKRDYYALVHGRPQPAQGTVDAAIGRHRVDRTRMALDEQGKPARTHYRSLEAFSDATLLECSLDTGRTHQIRVHMSAIGHPLVGDPTYGKRRVKNELLNAFARQALHAARLALAHPHSGAPLEWESPLPADFAALLEALRE